MKGELGGKIMTEFVALRPKIYSYLKSDSHVPENFCQIKIFPSHFRKNTMICLSGA